MGNRRLDAPGGGREPLAFFPFARTTHVHQHRKASEMSRSESPTATLTSHPLMRGFLASLFTAGLSTMILALLFAGEGAQLPYVFIVVWVAGSFASQIQERMRRNTE